MFIAVLFKIENTVTRNDLNLTKKGLDKQVTVLP